MNKVTIIENFNQIEKQFLSYPSTILYMNIRSLRLNFTPFLASIHNIINNINFILLVETNISDDENNIYNIEGFNSHFLNREGRGGGIAVYVRDNIINTNIYIETISFEAIQINVSDKNKTYSLITIYRPPNKNIKEFIIELDKILNTIKNKQDVIVMGDINIDILTQNITTTKYMDMLASNGLQCIVNENTRVDINKNTSTCIDHLHIRNNTTTTQTHASIIKTSMYIRSLLSLLLCI